MDEARARLWNTTSNLGSLLLGVSVFIYERAAPAGTPDPPFLLPAVVVIVAVGIILGLIVTPDESSAKPGSGPASHHARNKAQRASRWARSQTLPLFVAAVLIVIVIDLSLVPVGHFQSTTRDYTFSFASSPVWNHTISLPGFGETAFNWSEIGTYNAVHVTLVSQTGLVLYSSPPEVSGYGGAVLSAGMYFLDVQEGPSTNTQMFVTIETSYSWSAPEFANN